MKIKHKNLNFLAATLPGEIFMKRAKMQPKKIILVFGPGETGFCGQVLSKTKNPLEALENGRSLGGILNVFFFKTYSKFRNRIFEASFFLEEDWRKNRIGFSRVLSASSILFFCMSEPSGEKR